MSGLDAGGAGRCLCGAVTYAFDGAPLWQAHCHCESCRRATSSAFASYFGVADGAWRWTGAAPLRFASSPRAERFFCGRCGSPLAYRGTDWPGEMHFFAGTLRDPAAYQPTAHAFYNEHVAWGVPGDGLKRLYRPRQLGAADDFAPAIALLRAAFAGMAGRIDPPSNLTRMSDEEVRADGLAGEFWVIEDLGAPVACMVLQPKGDHLYLGKLAVAGTLRRQGFARALVGHAVKRAAALGLPEVRLQVRIELTENQASFARLGFVEIERTAHEGYDRPTSITMARPVPPSPSATG